MRHFLKAGVIALVYAFATSPASAATITFDDVDGVYTNGQNTSYISQGFLFTPARDLGDTKCATGRCLQELNGQGVNLITTMTRLDNAEFDLGGFFFSLVGNGTDANNNITVTGFAGLVSRSLTFTINTLQTLNNPNASVAFAECVGNEVDDGFIRKNCGYTVSFNGFFDDVDKVVWTAGVSAETRLDDIVVGEVPLPAAGWLLIAGLGGLAAMRRRKTV